MTGGASVAALVYGLFVSTTGDMTAFGISLAVALPLGVLAAILECAAYDNIICPKCGCRIADSMRESFTRENLVRHRAISARKPVACVHCGAMVETA